jgi:NADH-quinone oxidoreductase subunit J
VSAEALNDLKALEQRAGERLERGEVEPPLFKRTPERTSQRTEEASK